jgi:ABC-type lipoprotein export system ATPase subunit
MIYSIIKDIRNKYKNLTIICVTHDDVLARGPDRRTVVIDGGKVKEI